MTRIKNLWWVPIAICACLGILTLVPGSTTSFMGYSTLWPYAPLSTVGIWGVGGILYAVGRWVTARPLRP